MARVTRRGIGRTAGALFGCLVLAGGWALWRNHVKHQPATLTALVLQDTTGLQDNSVCLVCHIDFETEDLVAVHLKAGIVCAGCHGLSENHRSDEANITKPDILFGRSTVGPFCKACHPRHVSGHQYQVFLNEWRGRRRPNGRLITPDSACTDCHGNHAILRPDQQTTTPSHSS
jgi:hypothetical protein